jgi:regulatory protein
MKESTDRRIESEDPSVGELYVQALPVALRFIAFRPRSIVEVRKRLAGKYLPEVVDRVVEALLGWGYLDDARFANQWRESRERRNPRGVRAIGSELRQKGIAGDLIDVALSDVDDALNAYRAGHRRAERWISGSGMECDQFRRKMWDFLNRRGFGADAARNAVSNLWDEFGTAVDARV